MSHETGHKVSLKCFHSTCWYLHPYLPFISLNECGGGGRKRNHRTPKTAAAYKECEGPQPREQAGKPYHIWQQRQNLIFINERSGHKSGLTCKGWAPILDGVWYVLVSALWKQHTRKTGLEVSIFKRGVLKPCKQWREARRPARDCTKVWIVKCVCWWIYRFTPNSQRPKAQEHLQ